MSIAINVATMRDNIRVWTDNIKLEKQVDTFKWEQIQYEAIIATSTAQLKDCKNEVRLWHLFMGENTWKTIQKLSETK